MRILMTKYFEVTKRDGAARLGRLILQGNIPTPLILKSGEEHPIIYAGSLWDRENPSPEEMKPDKLVILPDKSVPLHARAETVKEIIESGKEARQVWDDWDGPIGRVVHPAYPDTPAADLYAIGAAKQLENNPRVLRDIIIHIKNSTPPDTALYAPALATPENISLLIYLGIDVVDDILPTIRAYNNIYMMPDAEHLFSDLSQLSCMCSVCNSTSVDAMKKMDAHTRGALIASHNCNKLEEEKRISIQHIRDGNLREYVEGKCRSSPWLTALLRLVDQEHSYLETRTPTFRRNTMYTNTSESLNRVEITRFADRVKTRYHAANSDILLLLPCSARKPYSISNSHQMFSRSIGKNKRALNEVIITSPLGIVPRELELVYPAAHYDTPVTGHWDLEEHSWVTGCLTAYLKKTDYKYIIAHVNGAYRDICESASEALDLEIIYSTEGSVTSTQSFSKLKSIVQSIVEKTANPLRKPADITKIMMRSIADYQFGMGAGELLVPENTIIKAPFPKHQVFVDKKKLADLNPRTGEIIPSIEGARRLCQLGTYQVLIDDFLPGGTLLAPGVLDADPEIRPSDQVIIIGEKVIGVGRALMCGEEMVSSSRGVAVDLRDVKGI
jgi:archaeosine synthase